MDAGLGAVPTNKSSPAKIIWYKNGEQLLFSTKTNIAIGIGFLCTRRSIMPEERHVLTLYICDQ